MERNNLTCKSRGSEVSSI